MILPLVMSGVAPVENGRQLKPCITSFDPCLRVPVLPPRLRCQPLRRRVLLLCPPRISPVPLQFRPANTRIRTTVKSLPLQLRKPRSRRFIRRQLTANQSVIQQPPAPLPCETTKERPSQACFTSPTSLIRARADTNGPSRSFTMAARAHRAFGFIWEASGRQGGRNGCSRCHSGATISTGTKYRHSS